jgi:primosomal protein N'
MYLVHVLPLSKSRELAQLSYFSGTLFACGDIVEVPLRKKTIKAVVLEVVDARSLKQELKTQDFAVRKVVSTAPLGTLASRALSAVAQTADYYLGSSGQILRLLGVEHILDEEPSSESESNGLHYEVLDIQKPYEDRISFYRTLTREMLSKHIHTLVICPNSHYAEQIFEDIRKGIEEKVFCITPATTEKQLEKYKEAQTKLSGTVTVLTPSRLLVGLHHGRCFIVEDESNRNYIHLKSPYFDVRRLMQFVAQTFNSPLYFGADFLSIERHARRLEHSEVEAQPLTFRQRDDARRLCIDAYNTNGDYLNSETFKKQLQEQSARGERIFIFVAQKGLYPLTACRDCHELVRCSTCRFPLVLHQKAEGRIYICRHCGTRETAERRCTHCESWNLDPLGAGLERFAELLTEYKLPYGMISSTHTPRESALTETLAQWGTKFSILCGTELALHVLPRTVDHIYWLENDILLSLPDLHTSERIHNLITKLQNCAVRTMTVSTRMKGYDVFSHFISNSHQEWVTKELESRKRFSQPPYTTLIKCTITGNKEFVQANMERLQKIIAPTEVLVYPAFVPHPDGVSLSAMIQASTWPESDLAKRIRSLPPYIKIEVEPRSLI